jgi:hypothetical protein
VREQEEETAIMLRRLRFAANFAAEYKMPNNNNFMQSLTIDFLLICYSNMMRFFYVSGNA